MSMSHFESFNIALDNVYSRRRARVVKCRELVKAGAYTERADSPEVLDATAERLLDHVVLNPDVSAAVMSFPHDDDCFMARLAQLKVDESAGSELDVTQRDDRFPME